MSLRFPLPWLLLAALVLACSDEAAPAQAIAAAGAAGSTVDSASAGGANTAGANAGGANAGGANAGGASAGGGEAGSAGVAGESAGKGGSGAGGQGGSAGAVQSEAVLDLIVVKNGVAKAFDRAQFGLTTLPEGDEVYVEAHLGGDPACPAEGAPTPALTFLVSGLPATDAGGAVLSYADGVRANLFDFDGSLGDAPLLKGTSVTVTRLPSNHCATCPAGDPARFAAFSIEALLNDGSEVKGTVRASHCGSLDE